jgi:hypothetical protein
LASGDGAEVRQGSVQTRQPQQALDEARCLAKRHPKKHFHRQARLDGSVSDLRRFSDAL